MTKREEFGLEFIKLLQYNEIKYYCRRVDGIVDQYNLLQFISRFNVEYCLTLINEIDTHLSGSNFGLSTQFFEDIDLDFEGTYLKVDEIQSISLLDLKDLIQEWLDFLNNIN